MDQELEKKLEIFKKDMAIEIEDHKNQLIQGNNEILHQQEYERLRYRANIDFSMLVVKTLTIINGGASLALLSYFSSHPRLDTVPIYCFSIGTGLGILAGIFKNEQIADKKTEIKKSWICKIISYEIPPGSFKPLYTIVVLISVSLFIIGVILVWIQLAKS